MMRRTEIFSKLAVMFAMAVCLLTGAFLFDGKVTVQAADEAGQVEVVGINYNDLTMTLSPAGNTLIYYSKNKNDWNELEYYTTEAGNRVMDISWMSESSDTKIYFKGDKNTKPVDVTIPKRGSLKVKFNKADGTLSFDDYEDAKTFQWRKATDYNWSEVSIEESAADHQEFLRQLENLRIKGAKIIIRTPAVNGTSADDTGARPSKEVNVSVPKRNNAPSITLNMGKLTANTTDKYEYKSDKKQTWESCDKNMAIKTLLPHVFLGDPEYGNGTLMIRKAATDTAGYSKTIIIPVAAQRPAPDKAKFVHYQEDSRFVFYFEDASKTNPYEYMIVKPDKEFAENGTWKTVTSGKLIKLSKSTAPDGSTIYFRYKGIAANKSKGIDAVLPSPYDSIVVTRDTEK